MKFSIFGFVVFLLLMFVCKGMHNGEDLSDSDESGKAVGNCEDLDFDDMMASIENYIEEDPEFINELFGKEYLTRNRGLKFSFETTKWGKLLNNPRTQFPWTKEGKQFRQDF